MTVTVEGVAGPPVDEVILPGSATRLRSSSGVFGPSDVPRWTTRGGAAARAAAGTLAGDALVARCAARSVRAVLADAAAALGWQGTAARAAQDDAAALAGHLGAAADRLDVARHALVELASALDRHEPVLGPAAADWGRAVDDRQRVVLLARWRSAIADLDAADARAAGALHDVATALRRLSWSVEAEGWLVDGTTATRPASRSTTSGPGGVLGDVTDAATRFGGTALDGAASLAAAAGHHPGAAVDLFAGLLLVQAGMTGEIAGTALDLSAVGAAVGVPVNVAAAGAIGLGAGLMTMGAAELGAQAAGDDHVARAGDGRAAGPVDISGANFAQRTASDRFSLAGDFKGRLVDEVVGDLRSGRLTAEDVPVNVITRDGKVLILNTRSSLALEKAGIPRSRWRVVDRTGQARFERRLDGQLSRNGLESDGVGFVEIMGGEAR